MVMIDSISSIFYSTPEVYTAKIFSEQYVPTSIHVFLTCGGIRDLGYKVDGGGGYGELKKCLHFAVSDMYTKQRYNNCI
mgnify:CR=1 FL=1